MVEGTKTITKNFRGRVNVFYFSPSHSYCSHGNDHFRVSQWQKCLVTDPRSGYTETTVQTTGLPNWKPN